MGRVTKRDRESLSQLVLDCSMYNFNEKEALNYIKGRLGKEISDRTYRRYKGNLENGNISEEWLNYFTRTGIVVTYQQVIEGAKHLLESSMHRLYEEENSRNKDEILIIKLKQEIREELGLVSEFSLGMPVLAKLKSRIDNALNKYNRLIEGIRIKNPELLDEINTYPSHYRFNSRWNYGDKSGMLECRDTDF